jgi:hypothetical protein
VQPQVNVQNKTNSGGMASILSYDIKMPSRLETFTDKVTSTKLTASCYDYNSNNTKDFRRKGFYLLLFNFS